MKKLLRPLAALALVALAFTVPAAVVARDVEQAEGEGAAATAEEEQLEEFEPTEQVDADEAISFPVDI